MADSGPHNAVPFGKYLLLKRVAVGGMAELYLAKDTEADRFVVIKRILPYLAQELEFVRMFLDEARIAAQLHHPSIITMFELGSLEGSIFIAMEFVEGVDLRKILQQEQKSGGVVPPRIAAWLAARLCEGLHYAHNRTGPDGKAMGIIHRDVSPQNLMVGYRGEVKLVDFGIAKASALMERSKPGVIKGKFLYLSPEQLSQERIDHRSDLFALGTMIYEVCVGKSPFFKPTTEAVIYAIRAEDPPPPHLARPGFPLALSKVIMKLLQKDRARRYQQAGEVERDLQAWLDTEEPTSAEDIERYVARLFGGEEERTVMFLPESKGEGKANAKTSLARSIRLPQPTKKMNDDGEESLAATAPEGRRPTPEPMRNPFDDDPKTVLGLQEETRPLAPSRLDREEPTVDQRPRQLPVADDFLEPTAISKSGEIRRSPSGESLSALTPALGQRLHVDADREGSLPPAGPKSSKVFEVPFEFARDEVPTAAPPRTTRGAPPTRGVEKTEDDVGELINAAEAEAAPRGTREKKPSRLGASSDDDDFKSTADYRRQDVDDVPSMVTQPSQHNQTPSRFNAVVVLISVTLVTLAAVLSVVAWRRMHATDQTIVKPVPRVVPKPLPVKVPPVPVDPPVVDAGAAQTVLPQGTGGGGGSGLVAAGGGKGTDGAGGGGGLEKPTPPVVQKTKVYFDAPRGSRIIVKEKPYKPQVDNYFDPGPYSFSYQCFKRRRFGKTQNMKMMVPKQAVRFPVKLPCR